MYCKHCGKEITDDSCFCPYCGKSQESSRGRSLINLPIWIIYLIWTIANLILLTGEKGNARHEWFASDFFYPSINTITDYYDYYEDLSWDKRCYDFSEFIVYVFILPFIIYVIYRRYNKWIDKWINKLLGTN